MKRLTCFTMLFASLVSSALAAPPPQQPSRPEIRIIDPPEKGFFSKVLDFHGVPIKSHLVVSNEALYEAYDRISMELKNLPMVVSNLAAAGAELHIIGRDQVTTDLPEWQQDKHVPLYEPTYNGLTRDRRTRGMGGLVTSCGEENLLKLPTDRYRGRDICLHEFAHDIEGSGIPQSLRARFDEQAGKSKEKGLWLNSYAGSNPGEYFAELTMWYFGTHGDMNMTGPKPEDGPEGLKKYDPEAYVLFDDFYSGRIPIERITSRTRPAFTQRSITNLDSFAARLINKSDPVAAFVNGKLDDKVREELKVVVATKTNSATALSDLVAGLNKIAAESSPIYETQLFKGVQLRTETTALIQESPEGSDLVRLNRMLLEDAFPQDLARNNFGGGRRGGQPGGVRAVVAHLTSYKVGETKLSQFFTDAGMTGPGDEGKDAWHVAQRDAADAQSGAAPAGDANGEYKFHITYKPSGQREAALADLDFKAGVLTVFKWDN